MNLCRLRKDHSQSISFFVVVANTCIFTTISVIICVLSGIKKGDNKHYMFMFIEPRQEIILDCLNWGVWLIYFK